ncbi:MYPU_1760 family metalloprotease [Mycoplasma elephantis]|uniref:MYPU_1760 family metalloprotease n=1 Tax=Mycoplasma elephantis TaxID=114882 RepID=UPI0004836C76|nr:hypothetical protein [Mycoplasma elephantis]
MNNKKNNSFSNKWLYLFLIPLISLLILIVWLITSFGINNKSNTNSWTMEKYYNKSEVPTKTSKRRNNEIFWDEETEISFISYEKSNNKLWFNKKELSTFVDEFKKVITYGPEINLLNAVVFDDPDITDPGAYGLYVSLPREIHVNTSRFNQFNLTLKEKIDLVMPTLFHEYMHHWANIYVNNGLISKIDKNSNEDILYTYNDSTSKQLWDGKYVNNFIKLLNYDKDWIPPKKYLNKKGHATRYFNIKNIFDYSNYNEDLYFGYKTLKENSFSKLPKISDDTEVIFDDKFDLWLQNKTSYDLKSLKYYYSMTELLPREWLKVAYQLPFDNITKNGNEYSDNIDFKRMEGYKNVWYKSGMLGLIIQQRNYNKFNPFHFGLKDNAHVGCYPKPKTYQLQDVKYFSFMNTFIDDWTRTTNLNINYLNGNIAFTDSFYPNNLFDNDYNNPPFDVKIEGNTEDFLKIQLEAMSYGKNIAQIFSRLDKYKWTSSKKGDTISYDSNFLNEFKIMGYLENKKVKNIVYYNSKNDEVRVPLRYTNNTFKSKKVIIQTKDERKSFWYPNDIFGKTYFPYITDSYIDINNVKSELFFWDDINNDNIIQDREKISGFTIPDYKIASTFNSSIYDSYSNTLNYEEKLKIISNSIILYKDENDNKKVKVKKLWAIS